MEYKQAVTFIDLLHVLQIGFAWYAIIFSIFKCTNPDPDVGYLPHHLASFAKV